MHTTLLNLLRTYPRTWLSAVALTLCWLASSAHLGATLRPSLHLPTTTVAPATAALTMPKARAAVALAPGDIKIEAEAATLNGVDIVTTLAGYSGTGYAWNFVDDTDNIVFNVPGVTAGKYTLTIGYYSPYGDKHTYVKVNAGANIDQTLVGTGEAFKTATLSDLQLVDGQNTITLTKFYGYYGIDYIILTPAANAVPTTPQLTKLEAESAVLTGVNVLTNVAGYSGTGYVWDFDMATDNIAFNFAAAAGLYQLTIVYYSPYGEKHTYLKVNSGTQIDQTFTGTGTGFGSVNAGNFQLLAGQNTITMTDFYGYYGIDYILLTPVTNTPPPHGVSAGKWPD